MMATIRIYIYIYTYIYIYILHVHNCIVQLKSTGRVVQNVWKRMIERKNITTTLGNVCSTYAERMGTYKNLTTLREGCTERMRTYDNDLFCSELLYISTEKLQERVRNFCILKGEKLKRVSGTCPYIYINMFDVLSLIFNDLLFSF
jgi:hypothetical protein